MNFDRLNSFRWLYYFIYKLVGHFPLNAVYFQVQEKKPRNYLSHIVHYSQMLWSTNFQSICFNASMLLFIYAVILYLLIFVWCSLVATRNSEVWPIYWLLFTFHWLTGTRCLSVQIIHDTSIYHAICWIDLANDFVS